MEIGVDLVNDQNKKIKRKKKEKLNRNHLKEIFLVRVKNGARLLWR